MSKDLFKKLNNEKRIKYLLLVTPQIFKKIKKIINQTQNKN